MKFLLPFVLSPLLLVSSKKAGGTAAREGKSYTHVPDQCTAIIVSKEAAQEGVGAMVRKKEHTYTDHYSYNLFLLKIDVSL